jgi:hypothetical protein
MCIYSDNLRAGKLLSCTPFSGHPTDHLVNVNNSYVLSLTETLDLATFLVCQFLLLIGQPCFVGFTHYALNIAGR